MFLWCITCPIASYQFISYRQIYLYKTHHIPNFKGFLSRLAFVFAQSIEAMYYVENEDVVGVGSADRRCSNYIWVINNCIAYYGAPYIGGFTVPRIPL